MPCFLKDMMLEIQWKKKKKEIQWDLVVFPWQAQQVLVIRYAQLSDSDRHDLAKTGDPLSLLLTFLR